MQKSQIKKAKNSLRKSNYAPSFPVVGIGASAGGLETFSQLLAALPQDTGMAFVLIQHLDPSHSSFLREALVKATKMPIQEIRNGTKVEPNNVYVIPPNTDIEISRGKLRLLQRKKTQGRPHMSINLFFHSLAADLGERAIGIVLSGTATDGTEGLRAIKDKDGITFSQDPRSAKFSGMPQSAVDAGVVDFCLPIAKIAKELVRLSRHSYFSLIKMPRLEDPKTSPGFQKILGIIKKDNAVDFTEYKTATIKRRINRRMALVKLKKLEDYAKFLRGNFAEIKALYEDILIHVTSFFREPDSFKKLQKHVFPEIIKHKKSNAPVRIWVAGCSSGEEVYSLAISFLEYLEESQIKVPIQIFGSDISELMIEKARVGYYSESLVDDISPERLRRFFTKVDGGYRINKFVRDLCVFVRHDLARDPPFSKLDLITCRNVLIYFDQPLQKRIFSTFHYCLNQPGFLLLGRTESATGYSQLFFPVDKINKIFLRTAFASQLRFPALQRARLTKLDSTQHFLTESTPSLDISKYIDNLLLAQYAPCGVLVNDCLDILQYRGKTSLFLEHPPGQPELNLLKMVREGLFVPLKMALVQAKREMTIVRKEGICVKLNGSTKTCNLVVLPISGLIEPKENFYLVLFESIEHIPVSDVEKTTTKKRSRKRTEREVRRITNLEQELSATRNYLQSLNQEREKTNEALSAVNEELVSGNEELQSMNEELETAKEELQSTNEELTTVNDELQGRNLEINQVNNDLINLLNSVEIPILILDINRRIRRFTPHARTIMNLLPGDVGRSIGDIKLNIRVKVLDQQIAEVIRKVTTKESEVQDRTGRWYRIQIRPYKTIDNKVDGVVLSLIDINMLKRVAINAKWASEYATSIVEAVQIPLLVLDEKINVMSANKAFYNFFGITKNRMENKSLYDLGIGQWRLPTLKISLGEMLAKNTQFQNVEMERKIPHLGMRVFSLSAQSIHPQADIPGMVLLAMEDISDRKKIDKERAELLLGAQKARVESEEANRTKDLFLATLSHELRTPLTSLILQAQLLRRAKMDEDKVKRAGELIERAAQTQAQLIEDLLDISRIVTGKLKMEQQNVNLADVIQKAIDTVSALAEEKSVKIESNLDVVRQVLGDPVRLQQVVWNLLTNALKFSPKDAIVAIHLKTVKGCAQIRVMDQGIGIEPDFLPRIFTKFTQAENSNNRSHGGLGLGLAIVRHIVEMHGGAVGVESLGKNKGATFTVSLPLIKDQAEKKESKEEKSNHLLGDRLLKAGRLAQLKGMRILIVEDDPGTRESINEVLTQSGANVRTAASAAAGMRILQEFEPEELICDINMPEEDGYTFLRKVRKLGVRHIRNVPALALTARAGQKDRQEAFSAGFQMHLAKPIDFDQLIESLVKLSRE